MYLDSDPVVTKQNWLSGDLRLGTGAFSAPSAQLDVSGTTHVSGVSSLDSEIDFAQIVTPVPPAANRDKIYFKSDDNVYIQNSAGVETMLSVGSSGVTSVALLDGSTSPIYTISGSPVTTNGTLTFTLANQNANLIFAGPSSGGSTQPGFRSLVSADIPALPYSPSALTSAHIFVGSAGNVATDVAVSGDLTLANTGAFTITNLAVTNAKIANATIDLTTKVTGVLPKANGGAGQTVTGSTGSPQLITAVGGVAFVGGATDTDNIWFVKGNGGAVTVTANPQISAGNYVGQRLELIGTDDTNTITLQNGTGLALNGTWVAGNGSTMHMVWNGSVWQDDGRGQ